MLAYGFWLALSISSFSFLCKGVFDFKILRVSIVKVILTLDSFLSLSTFKFFSLSLNFSAES
jgi:hypothetical protein